MKHLRLLSCSFVSAVAFCFPQTTLGEMSSYFKTRQQTVQPINEVQASLIEQIDQDSTCKHLTKTILLHYDKTFNKKALKEQTKKANNHKIKLTRRNTSKKYALLSTHYMRAISPDKQGEFTNFLNVEVTIKAGNQNKCTHFYGYTLDNGSWKLNSGKELEHEK